MPRKHKNNDNVIQFPTTRKEKCEGNCEPSCPKEGSCEQEQQFENGVPVVLKKIDENRAAGMSKLEDKCNIFEQRDTITTNAPVNENTLRDIEGAIKATHLTLESMNSLLDMLRYDVIQAIRNIETGGASTWQVSAHVQTLIELLKDTGVVSEESLRDKWNEVVPKMIETLKKNAKNSE